MHRFSIKNPIKKWTREWKRTNKKINNNFSLIYREKNSNFCFRRFTEFVLTEHCEFDSLLFHSPPIFPVFNFCIVRSLIKRISMPLFYLAYSTLLQLYNGRLAVRCRRDYQFSLLLVSTIILSWSLFWIKTQVHILHLRTKKKYKILCSCCRVCENNVIEMGTSYCYWSCEWIYLFLTHLFRMRHTKAGICSKKKWKIKRRNKNDLFCTEHNVCITYICKYCIDCL